MGESAKIDCKGCALGIVLGLVQSDKERKENAKKLLKKDPGITAEEIKDYVVYPVSSDGKSAGIMVNHCFNPLTLGHLVVQPVECGNQPSRQIHDDYFKPVVGTLFEFVGMASRALCENEKRKPERVYFWSFNEQSSGNNWHLHIHVAPKFLLRGPEWLYVLSRASDERRKARITENKDEIKSLVNNLRKYFKQYLKEVKS